MHRWPPQAGAAQPLWTKTPIIPSQQNERHAPQPRRKVKNLRYIQM